MAEKSKLQTYENKRTPLQNSLIGLFVFLLCMTIASSVATQFFAAKTGYSPHLGDAVYTGNGWKAYIPYEWMAWGWTFSDRPAAHSLVTQMQVIALLGAMVSIIVGLATTFLLFREVKGMEALHGSAHWATTEEIDATGTLGSSTREVDGVYIGSVMFDKDGESITPANEEPFKTRYIPRMLGMEQARDKEGRPLWDPNPGTIKAMEFLRDNGPTHILVFAPTRSGKGRGLIIPTLFAWRHSVVVNDIKGENWQLTSKMRQQAGQTVLRFEPTCTNGTGACWNPLDEIRKFTLHDVADAQNIMAMVVDPESKGMDDHFVARAWELLTALALHMIYFERDASFAGMANYLSDPRFNPADQMYIRMKQAVHDPDGRMGWVDSAGEETLTHPVVANAAQAMLNTPEEERGSVLSTAKRCLTLFLDPIVAMNTSKSDFLVKDLMNMDNPVSCYYVTPPSDKDRLQPLSRLFFSMIIRRNAAEMEAEGGRMKGTFKHRLLMLIDEFPAMRKMEIIQDGLAYVAGYGIKMMLICQDLKQLTEYYGQNETIVAGCHVRIAYAPADEMTAERLEKMSGVTTITEQPQSTSANRMGMSGGNVSISRQKTSRPLMTQQEFLTMSYEDMVIFIVGSQPIYGRKIKYDEIDQFKTWSKLTAPANSGRTRVPEAKKDDAPAKAEEEGVIKPVDPETKVALTVEESQLVQQLLTSDFGLKEVRAIRAF
ncbi:type IV secretory system conjugative DNA transfer family protein [Aquitalea palustris]|uniref:type IV secretory system conjugative DNA transfer family protein n=1 Tax=Aquitalea palustris TaxID=2480983 RepID=UPI001CF0C68F|nr:type IV secretory system conjugative DNA transfer family protein [Aquitalea palustris]